MAYESDDIRPSRAVSRGSETRVAKEPKATATREGDDDLRPPAPSEDELNARAEWVSSQTAKCAKSAGPESCTCEMPDNGAGMCIVKTLTSILVGCVGIWLLLVVYDAVVNVIAAKTLAERIMAYGLLAVLLGLILFVVVQVKRLFFGMPKFDQVKKDDYDDDPSMLRSALRSYVEMFPEPAEFASQIHVKEDGDAMRMLARLKSGVYSDSAGYMSDFEQFQACLDERAREICARYSALIGIKTAISSWAIVDAMAVFFNSTIMICEIARVYNRKANAFAAFRLALRWVANIYISGQMGEFTASGANAVNDTVRDLVKADGVEVFMKSMSTYVVKILGKAVEGGANAYLARKLGERAIKSFRPLTA